MDNVDAKKSTVEITSAENRKPDPLKDYIHDIVLNTIPNSKSEEIINSEVYVHFDNNDDPAEDENDNISENTLVTFANNFSLKINNQETASGSGIIFSKDGTIINTFNEKGTSISYGESFEAKLFPEIRLFVYPARYISATDTTTVEVRKKFLIKLMIILGIQIFVTFFYVCLCPYLDPLNIFNNPHLVPLLMTEDIIIFGAFLCYGAMRRANPCNYCTLVLFTINSAFILGVFRYHNSDMVFYISFFVAFGTLAIIGVLAKLNYCDLTRCFSLIDALMVFLMIFYVISTIYTLVTKTRLFMNIFFSLFGIVMCFSFYYQCQLLFGKGTYALQHEEPVLNSLVIYVQILFVYYSFTNYVKLCL